MGSESIAPPFLTSALGGGEWSASRPCPGEETPVTHWIGGKVTSRAGLDSMEENGVMMKTFGPKRQEAPWDWENSIISCVLSRIWTSVTNNNGFWIRWLELLALRLQLQSVTTARNQSLAEPFFIDRRGLTSVCFSFCDRLQRSFVVPYKPSARTTHRKHIENTVKVKVKLSLQQRVKAHRVVRRRGSHIFSRQSAHRRR
jgi:hypothetical protein